MKYVKCLSIKQQTKYFFEEAQGRLGISLVLVQFTPPFPIALACNIYLGRIKEVI